VNASGRLDVLGDGGADLVVEGDRSVPGAPYLVTPYRREMLQGFCWHSLLAIVGLLEVLPGWLRTRSYAVGWLGSVSAGVGWFVAGVILDAIVTHLLGGRVQPWTFAELSEPPPGAAVERPTRTARRVIMTSWPFVFGVAVGVVLPPPGGLGGGFALAWALSFGWRFRRASRAEELGGWRIFSEAPERLRFNLPKVPESGYYRVEQSIRSSISSGGS